MISGWRIAVTHLLARQLGELRPLGDDHGRVGALHAPRAASRRTRTPWKLAAVATGSHALTSAPSASSREASTSDGASRMSSGVRLEREAEQRNRLPAQAAEVLLQLPNRRGASAARSPRSRP